MAKFNPYNPAALGAALRGDWENALVASTPGGIEAQEVAAQQELLHASKLPKEGTTVGTFGRTDVPTNQAQLEALGFVFGAEIDDLFVSCQLPQGWSIKPTEHSMWSMVYDEKGRQRMAIFYKGAFYDRSAHLSIDHRYSVTEWHAATPNERQTDGGHTREEWLAQARCTVVKDYDGTILYHTASYTNAEYDKHEAAYRECDQWLKEQYPEYESPFAYWD